MGLVTLNISMSVDGFVAGTNIGHDHPLGVHGERLHDWLFLGAESAGPDRDVQDSYFASTGAFVMGRRMFDVGLPHWGDNGAFGKPCFVLTHRGQDTLVKGPTSFNFVTDGVLSCLEQAKAAAGDRSVCVV
ncbi:MAG: dihydrofolate reductase, partial [bacterium]